MRELDHHHATIWHTLIHFIDFTPSELAPSIKHEVFLVPELLFLVFTKQVLWLLFIVTSIYLFNKSARIHKKIVRKPAEEEERENVIKDGD